MKRYLREVDAPDEGKKNDPLGSGDGRKEQASLTLGSQEYLERQRDLAGVEEEHFVAGPQGHIAMDVSDKRERRPDEIQDAPPEPEHVAQLAAQVRGRNIEVQAGRDAVHLQKTVRQMAKTAQADDVKRQMVAAAALTPEEDDDKKAKSIHAKAIESIPDIRDDSVMQDEDEFVPAAMRRFGFGE